MATTGLPLRESTDKVFPKFCALPVTEELDPELAIAMADMVVVAVFDVDVVFPVVAVLAVLVEDDGLPSKSSKVILLAETGVVVLVADAAKTSNGLAISKATTIRNAFLEMVNMGCPFLLQIYPLSLRRDQKFAGRFLTMYVHKRKIKKARRPFCFLQKFHDLHP